MTHPPEPWQLEIPFSRLAQATIGPVVTPFGFVSQEIQPNLIRYQNGTVYFEISHHPRDGEVAVDFGRIGIDERYSFLLYLRSTAPGDDAGRHDGVSWTAEEVQANLERFARALKTYGKPLLEGDASAFEAMKAVRWWTVEGTPREP